jgi:hypothetical protein
MLKRQPTGSPYTVFEESLIIIKKKEKEKKVCYSSITDATFQKDR